jgi:hypothetical protein
MLKREIPPRPLSIVEQLNDVIQQARDIEAKAQQLRESCRGSAAERVVPSDEAPS